MAAPKSLTYGFPICIWSGPGVQGRGSMEVKGEESPVGAVGRAKCRRLSGFSASALLTFWANDLGCWELPRDWRTVSGRPGFSTAPCSPDTARCPLG